MVFQSTLIFIRCLSYMVHPMKSLASVGLAQVHPSNNDKNNNAFEVMTLDDAHWGLLMRHPSLFRLFYSLTILVIVANDDLYGDIS